MGPAFDHHESESERLGEDEQKAVDNGQLCLKHGGGHAKAGTCQVMPEEVPAVIDEFTKLLK